MRVHFLLVDKCICCRMFTVASSQLRKSDWTQCPSVRLKSPLLRAGSGTQRKIVETCSLIVPPNCCASACSSRGVRLVGHFRGRIFLVDGSCFGCPWRRLGYSR